MNFAKGFKTLEKCFSNDLISKYPKDHFFFKLQAASDVVKMQYFSKLDEIFALVESIFGQEVCVDYAKKLMAKVDNKLDIDRFNTGFTELIVLYLFLIRLNEEIVKGEYEPPLDGFGEIGNAKRSEYKLFLKTEQLNIEVKALNFCQTFWPIIREAREKEVYIFKEYLPINDNELKKIRYKLMLKEHLDINMMVYYKSEFRKINKQIKNANNKFNINEKYNVLVINYNMGLDSWEVPKSILDPIRGILNINDNMNKIDAVIVLCIPDKCYSLNEIEYARENSFVIINPKRNIEIKEQLSDIGFTNFFESVEEIPDWEIFQIVLFDELKVFNIVPYWMEKNEIIKETLRLIVPEQLVEEFFDE